MTSSLVGSEMCIRDRSSPWLRDDHRPAAMEQALWEERAPIWEATTAAVSYTHLTLPTICSV
eukprot:6606206-Prorocentrum_lima.AAC.1